MSISAWIGALPPESDVFMIAAGTGAATTTPSGPVICEPSSATFKGKEAPLTIPSVSMGDKINFKLVPDGPVSVTNFGENVAVLDMLLLFLPTPVRQ